MYLIVGITLKTHTGDKIKLISVINHDNRHFLIFRNDCLSLNVTCRCHCHMHKFDSVLCDAPDFNFYFQFLISDDNTALGDNSNPEHALFIVKLCVHVHVYVHFVCVHLCVYVYVLTCIYIHIYIYLPVCPYYKVIICIKLLAYKNSSMLTYPYICILC